MEKQYIFEFDGTKEQFLEQLKQFPSYTRNHYRLDDYLVELSGDEIRFGVMRCGHSGGDWFIPTVTEVDGKTIFSGKISYIDPYTKDKGIRKSINVIEEILMWILLLPLVVIVYVYLFFDWIVRKIINKPRPKEETSEDNLFDLMENYLNCTRK